MWLLVGLGNPGTKYRHNRHNIGFMAADVFYDTFSISEWKKKFSAELSDILITGSEKALLLKPQTFMNASGEAVQAAASFYKISPENIVVFYDDLDLAPGKVKVKQGGGAGGHNGLRSLDAHLGPSYWRVRLGIGHPGVHEPNKAEMVLNYVLSDFSKADKAWLDPLLEKLAESFPLFLSEGPEKFLNALHQGNGAKA
ncbi:MAG TPA: aminoacyl-tRNA hydrolase [Alphaproteobacteria bacterium]|nr:aminoacyl-tRNA hydrolase [Alphaproteobacteria bacterium]